MLFSCRTPEVAAMRPQNPSPMVEYTRAHHRVPFDSVSDAGIPVDLPGGLQGKLYVPNKWKNENRVHLAIHFHGDSRVAQYAVAQQPEPWVLFHCHWGSGSAAYSRPIEEIGADAFLDCCWEYAAGFNSFEPVQEAYGGNTAYVAYGVGDIKVGEFIRMRDGKISEIWVTFRVTA